MDNTKLEREIQKALDDVQAGVHDADMRMVELFMGVDAQGREFYAYMDIIPSKHKAYKMKLAAGEALDPEDYGEVIEYGYAPIPPIAVQEKMKALGFDHAMETMLQAKAQELIEKGR